MPSRQPPPSPRASPHIPAPHSPASPAGCGAEDGSSPGPPVSDGLPGAVHSSTASTSAVPSSIPAEPSRAEPSRAEPCRAELHRAAPHRDAGPRRAAPPLLPPGAGSARTPRPLPINHAHPKLSPAHPPAKPRPPPSPQLRMGFLQAEPRRAQARNECGFLGNEIPDACRSQISLVFFFPTDPIKSMKSQRRLTRFKK